MTSSKTTKRALFSSALAMVVCVAMLIGTTFAWFTDTASSKSNKIQAGKLDVKLLMHDGNNYVDISENNDPIFGSGATANSNNASTLWEPGKTQVAYLAIENAGNLDLKYSVKLNVSNATKHLYEVMQYAITPDAVPSTPIAGWTTGTDVVEGAQDTEAVDVTLAKGATHYFALSIHMKESAGNAYQGGTVDFDITVLATQVNSESDSFGTDYDATAAYPAYSVATKVPTTGGELNLETNETNSIKATVPSEVVAGKTSVSLKHDGVVGNRTNNTITINALELVDENGNVIDLSGNTTKKLTITLPVSFSDGTVVMIAHDGQQIATAVVTGGKITYETYHLCDVTVTEIKGVTPIKAADLKKLLTPDDYSGTNRVSVILDKDYYIVDEWTPISYPVNPYVTRITSLTLDGQGHSIAGLTNVLFADNPAQSIDIKNVTIKDSEFSDLGLVGTGTGAFINAVDNNVIHLSLTNCHVFNSTITGTSTGTAGLVGYAAMTGGDGFSNMTFEATNCSVENCNITGANNVAGIIGFCTANANGTFKTTNCVVKNCKLVSNKNTDDKNDYRAGAVVGTVNGTGVFVIQSCTEIKNTIKMPNYKYTNDGHNMYGRAVDATISVKN